MLKPTVGLSKETLNTLKLGRHISRQWRMNTIWPRVFREGDGLWGYRQISVRPFTLLKKKRGDVTKRDWWENRVETCNHPIATLNPAAVVGGTRHLGSNENCVGYLHNRVHVS
jgi:hypothetical protein